MLNRIYRFRGRGPINYVYRKGSTVRAGHITLKVVESKKSDFRAAVVVSRKVSKSAVVRNRIRRRVYETIRSIKTESNKPWPVDIIVSVFDESIATLPTDELHQSLKSLLKKAKIL